ncbi:YggS family pyridoxal phosphate-dependent enzyme [Bacillaceae bacterium W0354]
MSLQSNYTALFNQIEAAAIRSNRQLSEINVIAVTKYVSVETANKVIELGIKHIGENRLEGFLEKYQEINQPVDWHFIGTLQSRKVKDLIEHVDYIHSLDRKSLAKEINKRATRKISCFVQVNTSGEESKHGLAVDDVIPFIKSLEHYENVEVVGLMTMAPHTDDEKIIRNCFRSLRELNERVQQLDLPFAPCHYLSMGMSNDFEIAIEEGATHIRIGTSLVGKEWG